MKLDLKYVRIYFDATTFDRITKDRSAKFVDKLSVIGGMLYLKEIYNNNNNNNGGTMGLLTGFSIISGVEILYFSVKIILPAVKKLIAGK